MAWLFWVPLSALSAAATTLLTKVGVTGIGFEPLVLIPLARRGAADPWRMAVPCRTLDATQNRGRITVDSWRCDPGVCLKDRGRKPSFDDALRVIMELVL